MINILNERFGMNKNFEIINNDVLKVNIQDIIKKAKQEGLKNVKVVANLPYYITTPIIMKLLEEKLNLKTITVMVQKEVAQRLTEKPGGENVGAITYGVWYYTNPSIIISVPKDCFLPSPEVDSAVIQLEVLSKPRIDVENEEEFFKLIKIAFMQKRKTLVNALENGNIASKNELYEILNKLNLNEKIRAEKLTLEDFANLYAEIHKKVTNKRLTRNYNYCII